jgi:serpin B
MEIANSIWYRNTFEVKQDFCDLNQNYFNAEVKPANFDEPATVELINNWVKTKTHDKIEKVINQISPYTVMYLINAIYFKGVWKYKFDSKGSHSGTFYRSNTDTSSVVYMNQESTFKYYENNVLKALELPYGNSGFSMVVLLPSEGKSVGDIVSNFTPANWNSWNEGMDSIKVAVRFPRFKFAYDSVINESLKTLGMPKAFDQSKADFSNINDEFQLYISFVLHKSFVEVNEAGTEAAAVTVVGVWTTSINDPENVKYFNANKPFAFVIKENSTQTILFSGVMNNPIYE